MQNNTAFSPFVKYHLLVGIFLGIWVYVFLVFIGPFDVSPMSTSYRFQLMAGYGLIFTLSYYCIIPIQNYLFKKEKNWNTLQETGMSSVVLIISLIPCFLYYQSDIIAGDYSFLDFLIQIFLPTSVILLPIILVARRAAYKYLDKNQKTIENITISGNNNLDTLHIPLKQLIFVKSANNYIEVNYLKNDEPNRKLIRTTTKKISTEIPELLRVHRSYLINPAHFIEWKNNKTISLTHSEIPVSDKYKEELLLHLKTQP